MADNSEPQTLTDLLNEWEISEDVIETFNEHGITIDLLYELTPANLKELCPHLATRVFLKNKIKEYLEAIDEQESDPTDDNDAGVEVLPNNVQSLSEIPDYFPELDLEKLLITSPEGCNVLRDYQAIQKLSPANQQLLAKVLVRGLFPWLQANVMKEHHYLSLLKKIHAHFPQEPLGVYYMSPVPKHSSSTNKPIPMRGKLVDKIKNTLFTTGIGRKRKLGNITASVDEKQRRHLEYAATHQEDLEWLKNNREPWNDVLSKWLNTFDLRVNSKFDSVHEFIQEWSILNDLRSKSLIFLDFEKLYPKKGDRFASEWPKFFDRMKMLRIDKYTNDKVIQKKKEIIEELSNNPEFKDLRIIIEFEILAHLVPPKGRVTKKNKHSTQESLDSVFIYVQNPGDISTEMDNQRKKALEKKETVQPYVIIQGNMKKHDQVLLVIDTIKYEFSSASIALDCLFKCFHVLQAQYPKASTHLHLLIQKCIYGVTTEHDIYPLNIIDIINVIEKL